MNVMMDVLKLRGGTGSRFNFERFETGTKIPELVSNYVTAFCAPLFFSCAHFAALDICPCLPSRGDRNIFRVERIEP